LAPGRVPSLAPLRTIRELHRRTAAELGMGSREDIESLLSEVQQLLVGISIMQVSPSSPKLAFPWKDSLAITQGSKQGGTASVRARTEH
jgi:hypothetical protein